MSTTLTVSRLPWSESQEDNRRLNRFLMVCLFPVLLISAIIPHLQRVALESPEPQELILRPVKLAFEPEPPPPPAPVVEPAPQPAPEVAAAPEPAPAATSASRTSKPRAETRKKVDRTAELKKNLQRLRDNPAVLSSLSNEPLQQAVSSDNPQRERLSTELDQGAVDIGPNTAQREKGQYELSGHDSTAVSAPRTGSGNSNANKPGQGKAGGGGGRSSQEIQSVFERHKAAINAIYERALRDNPNLAGKLVLRLTILPSGKVSDCQIISNPLGDQALAERVVRRVKILDFGNKAVPTTTVDYPIEFFPR